MASYDESIMNHLNRAERYLAEWDDLVDTKPNRMVVSAPSLDAATAHALLAIALLMAKERVDG